MKRLDFKKIREMVNNKKINGSTGIDWIIRERIAHEYNTNADKIETGIFYTFDEAGCGWIGYYALDYEYPVVIQDAGNNFWLITKNEYDVFWNENRDKNFQKLYWRYFECFE
jgi:hypothetical protein